MPSTNGPAVDGGRAYANPVQRFVALAGFVAMVAAALRLAEPGPPPDWAWPALISWCVGVPYWHYLEYRMFAPAQGRARRRFLEQQALSRAVWLGGAIVLAVALLRR